MISKPTIVRRGEYKCRILEMHGNQETSNLKQSCVSYIYRYRLSSTLAWKIPWSLVGCSPWGHEELDTTERLHFHFSLSCTGEGNGNPLQYSCLENPRDGGTWWAAVYGVTQSQTRLKQFSRLLYQKPHGNHKPKMYNKCTYTKEQSKHNIKDGYQITEQKRKGRKKTYRFKTINKMALRTYVS